VITKKLQYTLEYQYLISCDEFETKAKHTTI